jgi:hypothetical protein
MGRRIFPGEGSPLIRIALEHNRFSRKGPICAHRALTGPTRLNS